VSRAGRAGGRALAFVLTGGDAAQAARGRALAGALEPSEALALLPEPGPAAAPADWLPSLALLTELGALRDPRVERACAALARVQSPDGGFANEGDEEQRLQLSGSLGGYLARAPAAHPDVLAAVGDFLVARWSPERVQGFQLENLAAFAHYFANAVHEAGDEILQWCGRELERGFRSGAFDAPRTAHVLVRCDAHGLPGALLSRAELAAALDTAQAPDGGFGLPGEPLPDRVERTLQALAAWRHLGRPAEPARSEP
jgi:hypothetical protein